MPASSPPPHRALRPKPGRKRRLGLRRRLRKAALARHAAFMETVWKDSEGKPVAAGKIHEVEWHFLDRARAQGVPALILAPRSTGKTEGGLGYVVRRMAMNPTIRYQIICDNQENAQDRLGSVRQYVEKDPDFRWLFPEVEIDRSKRGRRTLSKLRLKQNRYAKDPTVEAAGVFGGATGSRADEQFYDDLCTERNSVLAPADRMRLKKLFFKTWTPILVPGGWWYYIGTLYHEDDLTHAVLANKRVAHLKIGLSEDFTCYEAEEWWPGMGEPKRYTIPLWIEGGWDENRYRMRYEEMLALGDASAFMGQYRNILIDPETAAFRPEWFNLPPVLSEKLATRKVTHYTRRVVYADPAFAKGKEACFYAGVVMGWDPELEKAVVLHAWRAKEPLSKRVDRFLDAVEEYQVHEAVVEGQHEGSFGERIEERAIERGIGIRVLRVSHGKEEKEARITSLGPLIERQKILADTTRYPFFRSEALVFPNGKKDALDALEGSWSRIKLWIKRRGGVPLRFPVGPQIERGILPMRTKYRFQSPTPKAHPGKSLAEQFFR